MAKTIEEEIKDYLNENDMYFVEEYDKNGFPINDEADDLVGSRTDCELCDLVADAMEYIAEVQRKRDIDKACSWLLANRQNYDYINVYGDVYDISLIEDFKKAMEEEQ